MVVISVLLLLKFKMFTLKVKQELARELHALLVGGDETRSRSQNRMNSLNGSSGSMAKVSKPNSTMMDMEESDYVIPLSMVALVEYASTASSSQVRVASIYFIQTRSKLFFKGSFS